MRLRHVTLGAALATSACVHQPPRSSLPPLVVVTPTEPRELLPEQQIQQVLNRLAFGPRPGDVEKVRAMGVDRWIALQLAPERIDDHATDELVSRYPTLGWSTQQVVQVYDDARRALVERQKALAAQGDTTARADARRSLRADPAIAAKLQAAQHVFTELESARVARAVTSERQLQEVMVDFWENHFSVFAGKGPMRAFLTSYDRDVIRPHALGRFRDLLEAVAKSPAMLYYLDNWESASDSLHPTLATAGAGRGARAPGVRPAVLRHIVETGDLPPRIERQLPSDLRARWEAARTPAERQAIVDEVQRRIATARQRRPRGLNENYARELMELHTLGVDGGYTQHDVIEVARALTGWSIDLRTGQFVFRPAMHDAGQKVVLGHVLPAGRGIEDGEEVLDILARSPATAHFIARELVVRFVSDSAPPALVERAAQTYLRTDGDIREVVRTIVTSPEFFSRAAYRAKVKSPFELVVSTLRAMNAAPDTTPRTAQFIAALGEPIFGHQTPEGWPEHGDAWMNTGAILDRINFGLMVAAARVPGVSPMRWPYTQQLRGESHAKQVDGVIAALLGGQASPETRSVLMEGSNPMLSRSSTPRDIDTVADDASLQAGGMMMDPAAPRRRVGARAPTIRGQIELTGLSQTIGLALGAPEFQRR